MSHQKSKRQKRSHNDNVEIEESENGEYNAIYIPDMNDSGDSSSDSELDAQSDEELSYPNTFEGISNVSYRQVLDSYTENQTQLEPEHTYEWLDGEKKYNESFKNEILLSDRTKKMIHNLSAVELFELIFSKEIKSYIIECTVLNGYNLTEDELDIFIGILVLSTFNQRKTQKDYWSTDPLLACPAVSLAMSRATFIKIKSKLKMNKSEDKNDNDKAWKVRKVLQIFRKNLQQFGFFSTALSVDEMIVKFHGRTNLQQFMQNKPERWGIKEWGIASPEGYLFDCDIYCGKGSNIYNSGEAAKLTKCALGSRVVLLMTQNLLSSVVPRKLIQYHLYFDNYFTNPDLLVHLKKMGLKATGTVRINRVKVKNYVDKKAERGTYCVKHERNCGLNFITVMDSKCVSVLSTAAGVSPSFEVNRFSFAEKKKIAILFPHAFKIYNMFMGGVDLHDLHCSNLMSCIRAKKWTWPIFMRFIQSSMANATVLRNYIHERKIGSKELAMDIAKYYLAKAKVSKSHTSVTVSSKKNCQNFKQCASRTKKMCKDCNVYSCSVCFPLLHQ